MCDQLDSGLLVSKLSELGAALPADLYVASQFCHSKASYECNTITQRWFRRAIVISVKHSNLLTLLTTTNTWSISSRHELQGSTQMWWHTLLSPTLGRQKQANFFEF